VTHIEAARALLGTAAGVAPEGYSGGYSGGDGAQVGSRVGSAVDRLARQVMKRIFVASHRRGVDLAQSGPLVSAWQRYADAAALDPTPFFPRPAAPVPTVLRRARGDDGWIEDLVFPSAYAPERDTAEELLRQHPENAVARARHYRHDAPGRPAVVCLHGWAGGRYSLEARLFRARWLYGMGLDVYLYVHPYHGARRPGRRPLRGTLHPSTNVTRTNEAFLQTAWEVRALLAAHQARTGRGGGVMGMSLGGYATAMLAAVAPELEFAVPILPIADMPALLWSWGEGTPDRARAEARGMTFERFCALMAVHSPLARPAPAIPRDRILLIAGRSDRIVPPVHALALWEQWGHPRLHWFPGSHLVHFGRGGYLRELRAFLREIGAW
jgi:pimeloyl-ACP methyl ester carboxylesterase